MKKSYVNLNDLPQLVKNHKYTAEEASKIIATDVLLRPQNYKVPVTNEEIRSELSVKLIQNADYIFTHFKPSLCTFRTYLCSFVHFQVMNIVRDFYHSQKIENHVTEQSIINYEEEEDKYYEDEAAFKIGHKKNFPKQSNQNDLAETFQDGDITSFFETKPSKQIRSTLVLALKSCYYLTPEHISRISKYCGINRKELETLVNDLKDSLHIKHEKLEKIKKHRDKSFELHMKFQKLIDKATNETDKQEYLKRYTKHTQNWHKKNILLQQQSYKVCPTNKRLAQILGVCERQIGYYLQNAADLLKTDTID